jgi:excisionase family DNA binding protein
LKVRKIFCEIVSGAVYSDRCLWKLRQAIEGNKACEECILRELEEIKSRGGKKTGKPGRMAETLGGYDLGAVMNLTGVSRSTIALWAKNGKIPARKIGERYVFPKEEIDRWLSEVQGERAFKLTTINPEENDQS